MPFPVTLMLIPCPLCGKTPDFWLPIDDRISPGGTWIWEIRCRCVDCFVKISVRKANKNCKEKMKHKLEELSKKWNSRIYRSAYEYKVIDLEHVERDRIYENLPRYN
jgi:hypothetical protein